MNDRQDEAPEGILPDAPVVLGEPEEEDDDDEEEEDGDDDDDDEEEEDPMEEEEGDNDDNEEEGAGHADIIEGGVAEASEETEATRTAQEADITLFFTCTEVHPSYPNHPVLQLNTTVQIGLDKNVRLEAVMNRYVQVCRERFPEGSVAVHDLEFVHVQKLDGKDTAESAALMKSDRVQVRPNRSNRKAVEQERIRLERESDKNYYHQLHSMLSGSAGTMQVRDANVVLDCRGKVKDEDGRIQKVLTTPILLYCHDYLLFQRCPWLGDQVRQARANRKASPVAAASSMPPHPCVSPAEHQLRISDDTDNDANDRTVVSNEDKVALASGPLPQAAEAPVRQPESRSMPGGQAEVQLPANAIENDDDEMMLHVAVTTNEDKLTWIVLEEYPPDAVKLLLEYVYTNRVVALGAQAFVESCRTKPVAKTLQGPVPPYPLGSQTKRQWPNQGAPTVSLQVTLATLVLANQARLPRLAWMCEVAASLLVSVNSVPPVLELCQSLHEIGLECVKLRQAAMQIIWTSYRHINYIQPALEEALRKKQVALVPTLLAGTLRAIEEADVLKSHKFQSEFEPDGTSRDWHWASLETFSLLDREDRYIRDRERRKRRLERSGITEEVAMAAFRAHSFGDSGIPIPQHGNAAHLRAQSSRKRKRR